MDNDLTFDTSPGDDEDNFQQELDNAAASTGNGADTHSSDDFGLTKQGYYISSPAGECCISDDQENGFIAKISPIFNTATNDLSIRTDKIWQYDGKTKAFSVVFKAKDTGTPQKPSIMCPLLCSNFISNYSFGL